jgi:hypothetical protein
MSKPQDTPKELDAIVDMILAYEPKPKSRAAKKRKKMAKKLASLEPSKVPPPRKNRAPY